MSTPPLFLVLAFDHPLQAVQSVAERIAAGLCCHGLNAVACSLPRDAAKLAELQPDQLDGVLSLGPMPLSMRLNEQPLWQYFKCEFTIFLLDALLYDVARVPVMREFLAAAQHDRRLGLASPEDGYRQWLSDVLNVRWEHLPFAAFAHVAPRAETMSAQPRLCVIGTVGGELGGSPVGETLPDLLARVLGRLTTPGGLVRVAAALQAPDAHPMPALTVTTALELPPHRALQSDVLPALIAIDSWIKRERRLQAVRSLAGVPVDFFGSGWHELLGDQPGFRHVGKVQHGDIAKLLPHYRGVVNFDPNWHAGVHDRVYTACAMGVPVLSNFNIGLAAAALPAELLVGYDANRPMLAPLVAERGLLRESLPNSRPHADVMARHNWATRMGEWLTRRGSTGA